MTKAKRATSRGSFRTVTRGSSSLLGHQVQIVIVCDLGHGRIHETDKDRLDDVGAHKGMLVVSEEG